MPLRTKGRYLASMTKMSYFPGGSCTRVYSPLAELTALWSVPLSVFLASTLTPAAGACAGSKTEPPMEPDSVWPKATIQQQIPPTIARRLIRTHRHGHYTTVLPWRPHQPRRRPLHFVWRFAARPGRGY